MPRALDYLGATSTDQAHFFNCLIQSNELEGWFGGPQIYCIAYRAPVTKRCFGCFLSLMTAATLKCKQFSCDLADEKVKNWGPPNVPPSLTEFETLEGAIKERCRECEILKHFSQIDCNLQHPLLGDDEKLVLKTKLQDFVNASQFILVLSMLLK